jgi:phage portal protein BeeE
MARPFENFVPRLRAFFGLDAQQRAVQGSATPGPAERRTVGLPRPQRVKPRTDKEWLTTYKQSAILRIPLNRVAEDAAQVTWRLWRIGDPGPDGRPERTEVLQHPLKALWDRPNPFMTGTQFRKLCVLYKKLLGRVPVRVFYNNDGTPQSLWPVPPHHVLELPKISNPPEPSDRPYWRIKWQGQDTLIPVWCLLWIMQPDPEDPYGMGAGDVECLNVQVTLNQQMDEWSTVFFRQGAHIDKIVVVPGLNEENIDEFTQDFEANHVGTQNVGRPFFVAGRDGNAAVQVVDLGKAHKELDWVAGQQMLGNRARHVLGVPPELVGDVTDSNRATAEAADYIHSKHNIKNELLFLAEQFNALVTPMYGEPDLVLEPDECVRETAEQKHVFLNDGWRSGTITRDEWRAGHGMKLLGGDTGRQINIPVNMAMMDAAGGSIQVASAEPAQRGITQWNRDLDDILLLPSEQQQLQALEGFRTRRDGNGAAHAHT